MTAPSSFSDLLAFVTPHMNSIPSNPTPSDMIDFGVACNTQFELEHSTHSDINPSNRLFQRLAYLAPMQNMDGVIDAVKQMEEQYRILDASEFSFTVNNRHMTDRTLDLDTLERIVFSEHKYHTTNVETAYFGRHIPNDMRGTLLTAVIKLGCIFSTLWGCYIAHEDSTMRILYDLLDRLGNDELPATP